MTPETHPNDVCECADGSGVECKPFESELQFARNIEYPSGDGNSKIIHCGGLKNILVFLMGCTMQHLYSVITFEKDGT